MFPTTQNKVATVSLDSDSIFHHIQQHIKVHSERAKSFNAVILIKITKNGQVVKDWTLDLPLAELYIGEPKSKSPDTIITISDEVFLGVMTVKINPQQALMEGKIKMTGNGIWMHKIWVLLRMTANAKL